MTIYQCKFRDLKNDKIFGGLHILDEGIICGCCGGFIPEDEFDEEVEILSEWTFDWHDFSDIILHGE